MEKEGKNQKIWDMTFKILLLETPKLFLPLIKEVFGIEYPKEVKIVLLNNEFYNKEKARILEDTSFQIEKERYYFECQFQKDDTMVFRMFEYGFQIGASERKTKEDYLEFSFPKSCVVYVTENQNHPLVLKMKIKFPNGKEVSYEVPTIRVQEYTLEEIGEKGLEIFVPFLVLRYRNKIKRKKRPSVEEVRGFFEEVLEIMREAYEAHKMNHQEYVTVTGALNKTAAYEFKRYEEVKKGVEEMITEVLEIPELEAIKEAARKAAKEATIEAEKRIKEAEKKAREEAERKTKETTLELLTDMYQNGIKLSYVESLAAKKEIRKEELYRVLNITE